MNWRTISNNGITLGLPSGAVAIHRVVFEPGGRDIAYVVPDSRDSGNGNAAMIAAAPRLREACLEVWAAAESSGDDVPEQVWLAAQKCMEAFLASVWKPSDAVDSYRTQSRRAKDRERQRRCRERKAAAKEGKDG